MHIEQSFNTLQQQCSGLNMDLDQWVFYPLLFNLMSILLPTSKYQIAENAKPCKKTQYICLTYFKEKLLVLKTCYIFYENFQDLYNWCILVFFLL